MNLHGIVRRAITTVNPDILVTLRRSTGSAIDANHKVVPTFADVPDLPAQVQALSGKDLQHPAMLNVQGVLRAVYMYGNTQGIVRPNGQGGDLLLFPEVPGGDAKTWLVLAVYETWPDWCKVGVVLQQ